jgi:hypothetical protein
MVVVFLFFKSFNFLLSYIYKKYFYFLQAIII